MTTLLKEPNIRVLDTSLVDGEYWYTVGCLRETSIWIHNEHSGQENKLWFQTIDEKWHINFNVFDVHEKFYTMLILRWA